MIVGDSSAYDTSLSLGGAKSISDFFPKPIVHKVPYVCLRLRLD